MLLSAGDTGGQLRQQWLSLVFSWWGFDDSLNQQKIMNHYHSKPPDMLHCHVADQMQYQWSPTFLSTFSCSSFLFFDSFSSSFLCFSSLFAASLDCFSISLACLFSIFSLSFSSLLFLLELESCNFERILKEN